MKRLFWKSDYETGNQAIDLQHRELFSVVGGFLTGFDRGEPAVLLRRRFAHLAAFLECHFASEALLREKAQEGISEADSVQETNSLREFLRLEAMCSFEGRISAMIADYLVDWALLHVESAHEASCEDPRPKSDGANPLPDLLN